MHGVLQASAKHHVARARRHHRALITPQPFIDAEALEKKPFAGRSVGDTAGAKCDKFRKAFKSTKVNEAYNFEVKSRSRDVVLEVESSHIDGRIMTDDVVGVHAQFRFGIVGFRQDSISTLRCELHDSGLIVACSCLPCLA